jgi:catechol 2,3-dioxygenase-like lactoylglutathione lyase family enzyme
VDRIHHVAFQVSDVARAVDWYNQHFDCLVTYQDASWAQLRFANLNLALVTPEQHPPHIGLARPDARNFGELAVHRDGSASVYIRDPSGNAVEIIDSTSLKETP